ncbi:MAG TPA: membrane dipeptidase [Firmicutes bacterium]|nr:membrane dipeptidase [Bacillota bacterium]
MEREREPELELGDDYRTFHNETMVIDSHNDTIVRHLRNRLHLAGCGREVPSAPEASWEPWEASVVVRYDGRPVSEPESSLQLTMPKIKAGGIDVLYCAVDVTRAWKSHLPYLLDAFGYFYRELEEADGEGGDGEGGDGAGGLVPVTTAAGMQAAKDTGRVAAVLAVENADALEGSLYIPHLLYRLGVRVMGLTHNPRADAADGNGEPAGGGLTGFGRRLVQELNRLGMLIDVSHISRRGFWDVVEQSTAPVIASHSCCAALCPHSRNLDDDQLRALAQNGGVVGITFVPMFVDDDKPTFSRLLDHFCHAVEIAGIDHVGLGSDFDGGGDLLADAAAMPSITKGLFERGFSREEVAKILGGNHRRVFAQVCG